MNLMETQISEGAYIASGGVGRNNGLWTPDPLGEGLPGNGFVLRPFLRSYTMCRVHMTSLGAPAQTQPRWGAYMGAGRVGRYKGLSRTWRLGWYKELPFPPDPLTLPTP
jgi:hypothetical protein